MKTGDEVIMYGVLVGKAQNDIAKGSRMTTENIKHAADLMLTGMQILNGRRRMFLNLKEEHLMDIIEMMEEWALPITGCLFQLFFVRTGIWM